MNHMTILRTVVYRIRITSGGDVVLRVRRAPFVRLT